MLQEPRLEILPFNDRCVWPPLAREIPCPRPGPQARLLRVDWPPAPQQPLPICKPH